MKRSTSCPSWSRKYSATVNPVRATRARAPGGSFICPYTRATLDVLSFNHLIVQIVTLTGSFSYSSKYRVTSVGFGNIVNQFHNQDSFADSSTTEKTNLTSLGIGGKKIDNLDTSDQNFLLNAHFLESRGFSVNSLALVSWHWTPLINGISNNIDDATKCFRSNGNHNWVSSVIDNITTDQTLSTIHSNGSDSVLSKMLGNLQDELWRSVLNNKGVKNFGKSILELYVNDGTNNRDNLTLGKSCSRYRWAH